MELHQQQLDAKDQHAMGLKSDITRLEAMLEQLSQDKQFFSVRYAESKSQLDALALQQQVWRDEQDLVTNSLRDQARQATADMQSAYDMRDAAQHSALQAEARVEKAENMLVTLQAQTDARLRQCQAEAQAALTSFTLSADAESKRLIEQHAAAQHELLAARNTVEAQLVQLQALQGITLQFEQGSRELVTLTGQLQMARAEKIGIEQKAADLKERLIELTTQNDALAAQIVCYVEQESRHVVTEQQLHTLERRCEALDQTVQQLQTDKAEAARLANITQAELSAATSDNRMLQQQVMNLESSESNARKQCAELRVRLEGTEATANEVRALLSEAKAALHEQTILAETERLVLLHSKQVLQDELTTLHLKGITPISAIGTASSSNADNAAVVSMETSAINASQLLQEQQRADVAEALRHRLEQQLSDVRQQVDCLKAAVQSKDEELTAAQTKLLEQQLSEQQRVDSTARDSANVRILSEQLDSMRAKYADLLSKHHTMLSATPPPELQPQLHSLQAAYDELQLKHTHMLHEMTTLRENSADVQKAELITTAEDSSGAAGGPLRKMVARLQTQLAAASNENVAAREEFSRAQQEWQEEVTKLQAALFQQQQRHDQMQSQVDELTAELEQCKAVGANNNMSRNLPETSIPEVAPMADDAVEIHSPTYVAHSHTLDSLKLEIQQLHHDSDDLLDTVALQDRQLQELRQELLDKQTHLDRLMQQQTLNMNANGMTSMGVQPTEAPAAASSLLTGVAAGPLGAISDAHAQLLIEHEEAMQTADEAITELIVEREELAIRLQQRETELQQAKAENQTLMRQVLEQQIGLAQDPRGVRTLGAAPPMAASPSALSSMTASPESTPGAHDSPLPRVPGHTPRFPSATSVAEAIAAAARPPTALSSTPTTSSSRSTSSKVNLKGKPYPK